MCVFDHVKECTPEALANVTDRMILKVNMLLEVDLETQKDRNFDNIISLWPHFGNYLL